MHINSEPMTPAEVDVLRMMLKSDSNVGYSKAGISRDPPGIRVEGVLPDPNGSGKVVVSVAVDLDHERSVNNYILDRVMGFIGRGNVIRYS